MIIIPMAGLSRRFTEAGYEKPKYMLEAHDRTLFAHAVKSFEAYFRSHEFLFVARDVADTPAFIEREARELGIAHAHIVVLDAPTRGQAETVALGLEKFDQYSGPLTIFNIDTFRPGFRFPDFLKTDQNCSYLEVFEGSGSNWSYVRPASTIDQTVAETTEKVPISNLCCTGLYHFGDKIHFISALEREVSAFRESGSTMELYVAPLYNRLIAQGLSVRYSVINRDEMILCGVPSEYEAFLISDR